MLAAGADRILDQQDRVLDRDAHQGQQTEQRRHRQRVVRHQQAQEGAAQRQRQGRHHRHRLHETLEQQHQHHVHAQDADQHGQAETGEQFLHHFDVARSAALDAGRQVVHARQLVDQVLHVADGHAVELGVDHHAAGAVAPVDTGRAAVDAQFGHRGQGHVAVLAGHRQLCQQRQVVARRFRQAHQDRHLALGQVQFRQGLIVVAGGGHAQRFADRRRCHAEVGGLGEVRRDDHFRAYQADAGVNAAQAGNRTHVALNRQRRHLERLRIVTGEQQFQFFARFAAASDGGACARHFPHQFAQQDVDLGLLALALRARLEVDRQGCLAHIVAADRAVYLDHVRRDLLVLDDQQARLLGRGAGALQRAAWRQFQHHLGLGAVGRRDEAARQECNHGQRCDEEQRRQQHRAAAVLQAPAHGAKVTRHHAAVFLLGRQRLEQVGGHHRRDQARHQQRGAHRDRRGPAELLEILSHHPAHKCGRQEHGDQGAGRRHHRQADLVGRLQGRLKRRLALAQVAHDVFDLDDGVIDQDADHQRQRQQGDHVERKAEHVHHQEGRQDRQGQGRRRHQRRAAIAQEEPDHQHGQEHALVEQGHGAVIVFLHRVDRVEGFLEHDVLLGLAQLLDRLAHLVGHGDLAGPLAARDVEADHGFAVEQSDRGRFGGAVYYPRHLVQADAAPVRQGHVERGDFGRALDGADGAHRLVVAADIGLAARAFALHAPQLTGDVGGRHIQGRHAQRVQFDQDLAV